MINSIEFSPVSIVNHDNMQLVKLKYDVNKTFHAVINVYNDATLVKENTQVAFSSGKRFTYILLPAQEKGFLATWQVLDKEGNVLYETKSVWEKVREWTLNLMLSSHTDIGLHNSQYIQRYNSSEFLDKAMKLCDETDMQDDKYRYIAEGTWFVRVAALKEGGFTDKNSVIVEGKTEIPIGNTKDLSCRAEIEGLKLGTEYVYRVGNSNTFDENVYSFKTHEVDEKQVFAIISDIHNTMKNYDSIQHEDAAKRIKYTTNIYNSLMKIHPETQFIISTGDNMSIGGNGYTVDDTNKESYRVIQELEMDQLFAPSIFRRVPFISATGNHETMKIGNPYGGVTRYHYNVPNEIYNEKGAIGAYTNTLCI